MKLSRGPLGPQRRKGPEKEGVTHLQLGPLLTLWVRPDWGEPRPPTQKQLALPFGEKLTRGVKGGNSPLRSCFCQVLGSEARTISPSAMMPCATSTSFSLIPNGRRRTGRTPADVGIRHPNHFLGAGCAHLGEKLRHPKQRTANGHSKVETTAISLHVNARCTASGEVEVCLNHTKS